MKESIHICMNVADLKFHLDNWQTDRSHLIGRIQ